MPNGFEMIACTYGVGKDDYIYVVLAYRRHEDERVGPKADEFVTWVGNAEVSDPQVGEGHYMHRGDKEESDWIAEAWNDFSDRSKRLVNPTPQWFELEAKHEIRTTA